MKKPVDSFRVTAGRLLPETSVPAVMLLYAAITVLVLEYFGRGEFYLSLAPANTGLGLQFQSQLWWAGSTILLFLILPMLLVRYGFRISLRDYGWRWSLDTKALTLYLGLYLVVLPFVIYASTRPEFRQVYPFYRGASFGAPDKLLLWEVAYLTQFLALEFFFRGFLVIGLERYIGRLSVWVAVVPYCMLHFHKPVLEAAGAIVAGLILGELARRTRTIFGGVMVHAGVALTMDMLALGQ